MSFISTIQPMSVHFNSFIKSVGLDPIALGAVNMDSVTASEKPVQHRRACDECRSRKLACSKDPSGCERCRRENIKCHYSEQKPMGRPRKRQHVESESESTDPVAILDASPLLSGTSAYRVEDHDHWILENGELDPVCKKAQTSVPFPFDPSAQPSRNIWRLEGGSHLGGFPAIDFSESDVRGDGNHSASAGSLPDLTSGSNPTLSDSNSTPPQAFMGPCSCLPSMYLALSSLQQLPSDIVPALKTVREAARTAADCIWCPQCGAVVLENANPPIESFQNTIGTILPIIANGYQTLLRRVDEKTDAAEKAGETITFRFHDYGGLCGRQTTIQEAMTCAEQDLFFNAVEMPPTQWRTSVRALLRIDIYGHEQGTFRHKGLKDLVSEMEYRQVRRHELLDQHAEAGMLGHGIMGPHFREKCAEGNQYGCLQILKLAKIAIDNLVIA